MNKNSIYLILVVVGISCFVIGNSIGYRNAIRKARNYKETVEQEIAEETLKNNPPPECHATNCPEYTFFDADGDGLNESIVTEYTTMTQQAGRIWVIDEGKVVFKSDEKAQISVKPNKDSQGKPIGLVIRYNSTYQLSPDFLNSFKSDYYDYKDERYVLVKTDETI